MCQVNVRRQIIMSLDVKVLMFARHRRIITIPKIQRLIDLSKRDREWTPESWKSKAEESFDLNQILINQIWALSEKKMSKIACPWGSSYIFKE